MSPPLSERVRTLQHHDTDTKIRKLGCICMLLLVVFATAIAWCQSETREPPDPSEATSRGAMDDGAPPGSDETEQDSPIDEFSTDVGSEAARSFLEIGLHANAGADTNPSGNLGASEPSSIQHLFGSLDLLRLRHNSETNINYFGGGTAWEGGSSGHYNQQQLNVIERIRWPRAQLTFRDSFHYFGEGDLVASTPAAPNGNSQSANEALSSPSIVSHQAYFTHVTSANLARLRSRRSSVQISGSFALNNYLQNAESAFNSHQGQIVAQATHQLTRKQFIGMMYRFQILTFPNSAAGRLLANSVLAVFQRTMSSKFEFALGAGPQFVSTGAGVGPSNLQMNASAQASLTYRWQRSGVNLTYNRLVTSGSDLYAGANSDIATLSLYRTVSRTWRATIDGGYTRATTIGLVSTPVTGTSYSYEFAGATIRHQSGRSLSSFCSYQFNNEDFGGCFPLTTCSLQTRRHTVLIGLDWSVHRIPLD